MCDFFLEKMEKDQGDLTDIIGGGGNPTGTSSSDLPLPSDATTFAPSSSSDFGNPFPNFQDPILNDFFNILSPSAEGGSMGLNMDQKFVSTYDDQDMRNNKPCSMLPRTGMVQMPVPSGGAKPSPLSPRAICPYPMMAMDGGRGSLQISSPRTTGMKRRKNQAKKVICIPAPAVPTGGRPTGEVVPSDLWAWRKYGQKPIKGSPYPRGYYRCSSSKGCSARKQVERSRTDPNMLVITYTSEHNHPWPTQRNALAGSTRSQHAKNNCSSSTKSSQNRNVQLEEPNNQRVPKQEPNKEIIATKTSTTTTTNYIVKEDHEEMGNGDKCIIDQLQDNEFDQELLMDQYKPMIPESGSGQPDDFFGDLQELEDDPMNLIFTKEYMEAKPSNVDEKRGDKASSDIFSLLEWG